MLRVGHVGQRENKAMFGQILQGLGWNCPFSPGKDARDFNAILKSKSEQMGLECGQTSIEPSYCF